MSTVNTIQVHSLGIIRARLAKLHVRILLEVAVCVVPAMTLVGFGALYAGSRWLFGAMLVFVVHHFMVRKQTEAITLIVALVPAMMLMRGAFYYSAPIAISIAAVLVQLSLSTEALGDFRSNKLLVGLVLVSAMYWWVSFVRTGDYFSNMRVLELSLAAVNVYLLGRHRSYLATAMVGLALSAFSVAVGLLPYGDRLGIGRVEDISIGNPIALGLSATLVFLLTVVDRGRWLLGERHLIWQTLLAMLAAICLALSTSRGSWLVTLVGLMVILILNRQSRKPLLGILLLVFIAIAALLQTDRGTAIKHYFDNASSEKSLDKRTTGRADQWASFPRVLGDSPIWGFGPGSGKAVSLRYTKEGKPWHALYLFVGTETGLIGLFGLAVFLGTLMLRGFAHWQFCGELAPLLALLCFMVIGVSVSGIDAISGLFLGFAFLGSDSQIIRLRRVASSKGVKCTLSQCELALFTESFHSDFGSCLRILY